MRRQVAMMLIGAVLCGCHHRAARSQSPPSDTRTKIDSGVWGFSGAGERFGEPKGVIGTCIWIYDESDRVEIADGECSDAAPGKFRVPLKPGRYVVHGPGGNKPISVKPGQWVKLNSVASLPMAL